MQPVFLIILFIVGACIGSYLCCEARRMRLQEKSPKNTTKLGARSVCLKCGYRLKWYDNIPIVSWLILRGKCRKCQKQIGWLELCSEIGTGIIFLLLGTTIDLASASGLEWAIWGVTLFLSMIMAFLAIYDGAYGELPMLCLVLALISAIIILALNQWSTILAGSDSWQAALDALLAVLILGGIYLGLYLVSRGKWVGDGDWLLGTAIGLTLGSPWLALIALCLTNLLACFIMYPIIRKKSSKKIHLGPFLVAAWVITLVTADFWLKLV